MSCREEVGVSFVVFGVLEAQVARHWFRSAAISRHLTNSVGRSLLRSACSNKLFSQRPSIIYLCVLKSDFESIPSYTITIFSRLEKIDEDIFDAKM
jgi:hypothetical protein